MTAAPDVVRAAYTVQVRRGAAATSSEPPAANRQRKFSEVQFRIAATFTDSLSKLTGEEQKAVKTTAFDLQMDPSGAGLSFHKLDRAKDRNFWSVRVSRDIRLIVHRTASSILLAYVGHHDGKPPVWAAFPASFAGVMLFAG